MFGAARAAQYEPDRSRLRMLVLLLLLGSVSADFSLRMPYLNPAGVTYTSHHAAYGPLAYKSYTGPLAGTPLFAAPYAAAPVAAAPYAAVPVAAPASAVVPVTRYSAQPAVLQNIVDVAHPKVATRRYQIRRPAIEKQFYDIEEKIIVRPAGSAVVELEQPISANQRGPTKVSPAVHAPQPLLRYAHKIHFGGPFLQGYLPSGQQPTPVHEGNSEYEESYQQGEISNQSPSTPAPPAQFPQPLPPQTFPFQPLQPQPFPPQQSFPFEPLQPQPLPPQQSFPSQPIQPQPQPPQNFFPSSQSPAQSEQPQLDSSDSVAIENPELVRSGDQRSEQQNINLQEPLFRAQLQRAPQPQPQSPSREQPQVQSFQQVPQQPQLQFQSANNEQDFDQFLSQLEQTSPQVFERGRQPQPQPLQPQQPQPQLRQPQQSQSEQPQPQQPQSQFLGRNIFEQNPQQSQGRNQLEQSQAQIFVRGQINQQPQPQFLFRSQLQPQFLGRTQLLEVPQAQPASRLEPVEQSSLRTPQRQELLRSSGLQPAQQVQEIPSARDLSPEQQDLNQRRLIELLTGQGPVSEVGSPVQARVISATPAPKQAAPTDSRSSTRRVVVNRPIQTVQEVDVVEPFTKLERVAVHQPALIKTANVELAHVPAVTPVVHAAAVTPVPLAAHYL